MTITIDSAGNVSPGLNIPLLSAVTASVSGQLTSTVVTGTAPFVVASTTQVANLNASQLVGGTWATPGSIGSTTPNAGAFNSLTMTGALLFNSATISAAGTNQGTATAITADNTYVTAGTGGVILPSAAIGREISITNNTASSIVVYPAVGASIENAAANAGTTLPAYATLSLVAKSTTNWWAMQPVYTAGANVSITQSANGTVTWAVSPNISLANGLCATNTFTASYTDGTVVDYTTGIGRISVGGADVLNIYTGGIGTTLMGSFSTTGLSITGGYSATTTSKMTSMAELGKAIVNNNASATYTVGSNISYVGFTGTNVGTLTINFPAAAAGIDGLELEVYTQAAVGTSVTFASTGATFVGAPATLTAGSLTKFIYHHATTQWLPRG